MKTKNHASRINDLKDLDQGLIEADYFPFTTSRCNYIFLEGYFVNRKLPRVEAVEKVVALVNSLGRFYPPQPDTDVSGIEEIY